VKVRSLKLENFMGYVHLKRVFSDKDIIGIIGPNKGGKSTIPEAIRYAIHGTSRAEREVELIHRGAKKMMVTLVLDDDGKKITIKRGRDIKGHGFFEVKGIDRNKEAQAAINKLVGYTKEDFTLTTFFLQGEINQFMDLRPTDKKKRLMEWLKNTHWNTLEQAALEDLKEANKKVASLTAKREVLSGTDVDVKAVKARIKKAEARRDRLAERAGKLEKKAAKERAASQSLSDMEQRLSDLMDDIHKARKGAKAMLKLSDEYTSTNANLNELKDGVGGVDKQGVVDKRAKLKARRNELSKLIDRADSLTGTCPILKEPCTRVKPDAGQVSAWKKETKQVNKRLKKLLKTLAILDAIQEATRDLQVLSVAMDKAKAQAAPLKRLTGRYKALKASYGKARDTGNGSEGRAKLKRLRQRITGLEERLGGLKGQVKRHRTVRDTLVKLDGDMEKTRRKAANLQYVAFMFGKNGIPSQEIENAFDEIEDEVNLVLERLCTALQLEFKPDREIGKWEDLCVQCGWKFPKGTRTRDCEGCGADRQRKRKDELQLRVLEDGEDEGFWMESGGGKTLVSLAVRLALTRLKQRQSGSCFNVLFLDEPDAMLDQKNKQAFIKLLTGTLVKEFAFEQIFWISHDPEIQGSIPHILSVTKPGKKAKAVWL